jgi:hypothetical protein
MLSVSLSTLDKDVASSFAMTTNRSSLCLASVLTRSNVSKSRDTRAQVDDSIRSITLLAR